MRHYRALRNVLRLRSTIVALAFTVACGKSDSAAKAESSSSAAPLRVALVTLGSVSDQAWNSGAYQGLLTLRDSLGAQVSNVQTKTPAEFDENFRQYGDQGYTIVFGHGFEFQDAAARVAPTYPKTVYVVTSGRVTADNVAGISFLFEEASYQAGMIAGAMTKTNTIGMIGGQEFPPVKASFTAFARGAQAVNPKVKVITSYIGNWLDVSAGKEQALAQIARGVDVVFQNADAAGLGVFQAAREKKIYAFGANADQNKLAPDVILGSIVIDWPKLFMQIAREVQGGSFKGHVITPGVKDDVVLLVLNPEIKSAIPATAIAASDSVAAMIKAGAFHTLDDILAGADTARPIAPKKP